jgi:hypothetical protein
MPVKARRFVRRMRGGAQAHLIEAEDGHFYVVKFRNNPQHRRILVNEWLASVFLGYLQIASPETAIIEVNSEFLDANEEVHLQLGSRRIAVEPGWHFGSRFPGNPLKLAVYDFLPDALIAKVENIAHFLGVYVFDKWTGNADARQSIFFRAKLRDWAPDGPERVGFYALMMDHGYVFDGPHWTFSDSPLQGLYFRPTVYEGVRALKDFEPWLERVAHFPEEVVDDALKGLPPSWVEGDEEAVEALLEKLMRRCKRVPELVESGRGGRANPFPNWT